MQSDAKSAFCKKSHQNDRPGLHFGGLWGHFGALWAPNGTPAQFFWGVENWMELPGQSQSAQHVAQRLPNVCPRSARAPLVPLPGEPGPGTPPAEPELKL